MTDQEREEFEFRLRLEKEAEANKSVSDKVEEFTGVDVSSPLFGGTVGAIVGIPAGAVIEGATKGATAPIQPRTAVGAGTSGEKWLRNYAGMDRPGFTGGVPQASAAYQRSKGQGPVSSKVTQKFGPGAKLDIAGQLEAQQAAQRARPFAERVAANMPAPVQRAGQAVQGAAASMPKWLGRGIAGGSAGFQGVDAANRIEQGDYLGGLVSGLGAVGSGVAMIPHPLTRGIGTAVGVAAPVLNEIIDRARKRETPTEISADTYPIGAASGGAIRGYAGGKRALADLAVGKAPAGLDFLKKVFAPAESKSVKLSEGLAPFEGGKLRVTQADRMRVGEGMKGGSGFPGLQLSDPEHAARQAAWMTDAKNAATILSRAAQENPKTVFSNVLGTPTQHHSNRQVFGDLRDAYFQALDKGEVSPEWIEKANLLIPKLTTGKERSPLFSQPFDVRDKFAVQELVDTFDRRGALASMFAGERTGGAKKGALPFYSRIVESYADPATKNAPTYAIGNRLFTLTGEAPEKVTDLHPAYDWLLKGKDVGVHFDPVPQEIAMRDFYSQMVKEKGRKPGTFEYTRGYPRSQDVTEDYLTFLQREGYKDGGVAKMAAGGRGELARRTANLILPPAENAARTQIIGTLPTYRKAAEEFQRRGAQGRGLDFGAGLGEGAKVMPGQYETYEPFARGWSPTYSEMSQIPQGAYNRLTNLNVLNVVPREVRDEIVQGIGRSMEPGGLGLVTTRGADVMKAAGRPGPEPMSVITSRDTYQKGFTNPELQEYLKYILGPGYDIERLGLGPAGAAIRKKAEGGLAHMAKGGKTPAWQRKEGQNPEGGLNAKGRASYKAETGGTLKRPQPEGGARRDSFCARMKGAKEKLTSAETARDPDSRINKALRKWNC